MTRSRLLVALGAANILLTPLAALVPAPLRADTSPALLDQLNRRWVGARCRLREAIALKDKAGSDGWTRSDWVLPAPRWRFTASNTGALFHVSSLRAFPSGWIAPGTLFVAAGWSFEDPRRQKGIGLDLRLDGSDVRARVTLHSSFGRLRGIEDLEEMERWARIDLFQVEAVDEALTVPGAALHAAPPQPATTPVTTRPIADARAATTFEMVAAAVEPNRLRPGESTALVLTYRIEGVGFTSPAIERRTILRDGEVLVALEAAASREPGLHESSLPMTLPGDLRPGVYELRGEIVAGDRSTARSTLFQVLPSAGGSADSPAEERP